MVMEFIIILGRVGDSMLASDTDGLDGDSIHTEAGGEQEDIGMVTDTGIVVDIIMDIDTELELVIELGMLPYSEMLIEIFTRKDHQE